MYDGPVRRRTTSRSRKTSTIKAESGKTIDANISSDSAGDKASSVSGKKVSILESVIYGAHLIFFFGYLVPMIGGKVRQECEGYHGCARHLRKSLFGYSVDMADGQWRDLRSTFPLLWLTLAATTAGHWICRRVWNKAFVSPRLSLPAEDATVTAYFRLAVGVIFLYVMHGRQALIVLIIAFIGFRLTRWQLEAGLTHGKGVCITWIYAIAVLLFKESYRLQHLPQFRFLQPLFSSKYGGMYRWQLPANFLILRIVSYSFDFFWAVRDAHEQNVDASVSAFASGPKTRASRSSSASRKSKSDETEGSAPDVKPNEPTEDAAQAELTRANLADQSRPLEEYGIVVYFSYIVYCPLYTAGPIMSFNAFAENTMHPQRSVDTFRYAIRWLLCLGLMEIMTSWFPFFAVMHSGVFPHLEPAELALVCYLALKMMWLKFLLTWRFFRLWALADGTLAPENMLRCMSNNCSLEDFWRGWHASFNKWIVRYMYKPMGGRDTRLYSVWAIFLFVAVWHDMEWKLVAWGLLNGVFYVLEVLAKRFAKTRLVHTLPSSVFRLVCVLSGATYILVLIAVNLTGYAVGVGGVGMVLGKFLTWNGVLVLMASYYFLAMAVSFMDFLKRAKLTSAA